MKKLFCIVILLPFITNAQTTSGIVKSKNNNLPVENTNIYALRAQIGTITNDNGEFLLNNKIKTNDTLQISHIGYISTKIAITDLKKSNYIILLEEDTETLNNVEITSHQVKLKSKLNFEKLASLEFGIYSFGSLVVNNKLYVLGGDASLKTDPLQKLKAMNISDDDPKYLQKYLDELRFTIPTFYYRGDLLSYDFKTDSWQKSEVKFQKRAYHNLNYYNNILYVLGGKKISKNQKIEYLNNEIEVFDTNKNTVTIDKTNPHQAADFCSFTYKDNIIIIGGSIKSNEKGVKTFTKKNHLYNITTGLWYELEEMPTAKEVKGALIGDKIYLIGNDDKKSLTTIESFDLITQKWQKEAELISRLENPAVTNNENFIYFFEKGKMCVYDIKSKQLKEYLIELELESPAMHFYNDKLYIIGGFSLKKDEQVPSSKTYSVSLDEFDTTRPYRIRVLSQDSLVNKN